MHETPEHRRGIRVIDTDTKIIVLDSRTGREKRFNIDKSVIAEDSAFIKIQHRTEVIHIDLKDLSHQILPIHKKGVDPAAPPGKEKRCANLAEALNDTFPPKDGIGDAMSNALSRIGLTKEKYAELTTKFHTENPSDCSGCKRRQKFVNWLGSKIGLPEGKGSELQELIVLDDNLNTPQRVHKCLLQSHPRCLPTIRVDEDAAKVISESGFQVCQHCPDYTEPIPTQSVDVDPPILK